MRGGRAYSGTSAKDLLRVEVDGVMYALPIARVIEIINPLPVVALPRQLPMVPGVAEYREQVLAVVDLRSLFGLGPAESTKRTKWVVVKAGLRLVGFVVDAVLDVFSSTEYPRREMPELDPEHRRRGIRSAYKHQETLVFLLDADRLAEPVIELDTAEFPRLESS